MLVNVNLNKGKPVIKKSVKGKRISYGREGLGKREIRS